jgi:hypothetical protein
VLACDIGGRKLEERVQAVFFYSMQYENPKLDRSSDDDVHSLAGLMRFCLLLSSGVEAGISRGL